MRKTLIRWRWIVYAAMLVCRQVAMAQLQDPLTLNTAANGRGGAFPVGSGDAFWYAAKGDTMHSITAFVPALVVGRCDPAWHTSSYSNNDWIAYDFGNGCYHAAEGCVDVFYQRIIPLPETNACGLPIRDHYAIAMDFYADNCVYEIRVNGATNYLYSGSVDPYKFHGQDTVTSVILDKGWQAGNNLLIVHIKSCPTAEGFLATANLDLTPRNYIQQERSLTICSDDQTFGEIEPGDYLDTIISQTGCDTIILLHLMILKSHLLKETQTICAGTAFEFNGQLLSQSGQYRATYTNQSGCDSTIELNLTVTGEHFLGKDTVLCTTNEYELSSPYPNTRWYDGSTGSGKRISATGTYWATATDSLGCDLADTIDIRFGASTYLPNVFSPNEDGANDCFQPYFAGQYYSAFRFSIYDRLGNLVFTSVNEEDCWDGTCRGQKCNPGVYLYVIEMQTLDCNPGLLRGDVTLLR